MSEPSKVKRIEKAIPPRQNVDKGHSASLNRALHEREEQIRNNDYETAVLFDANGKVLLDKRGEDRSVSFSKKEVENMEDGVLTHNHPSGNNKKTSFGAIGNSFSKDDLKLAIEGNLSEIRAVSSTYTFSIKRPKEGWVARDGWPLNPKTAYEIFLSIREDVADEIIGHERKRGRFDGMHISERAQTWFANEINRRFCDMLGFEYSHKQMHKFKK